MIIDTDKLKKALRKQMRREYKVNAPRCFNDNVRNNLLYGLTEDLDKDLKTLRLAEIIVRDLKKSQKNLRKFECEIKEGKR